LSGGRCSILAGGSRAEKRSGLTFRSNYPTDSQFRWIEGDFLPITLEIFPAPG
jgi:hypothetical protein